MTEQPFVRTRPITVIAQDPGVRRNGRILTTQVQVPIEDLSPGPMGFRVHVIDYDASTRRLLKSRSGDPGEDPYAGVEDTDRLVSDPCFHQQNVYAIAMATLGRFERALGRRVSWSFGYGSHQLKIAPHAFADANAFYSRDDEALMFGYFHGARGNVIHSSLAHDVVVHEATHALLDGLRSRYIYPSSPDQAAFHEGFADIVAILSVFSQPDVVGWALDRRIRAEGESPRSRIPVRYLEESRLRKSVLLGLAEEMGSELHGVRGHALRRSAELLPEAVDLASAEFLEPHRRGEVLVAAALTSFLRIWVRRLAELRGSRREGKDRQRVVEEGAAVAERLLTAAIRAIDYCPPVDLIFGDFLSALLTADLEVSPDDSRYGLRRTLVDVFAEYGIRPACEESVLGPGYWEPAPATLSHAGIHFDSMQRDPDEVFRFVWENRRRLRLHDTYTQVQSVRPTIRFDIDGFLLRETVAEYVQVLRLRAGELRRLGLRKPDGMANDREVPLYGGGALVFDEYGRLRFHIVNPVRSLRQQDRLDRLWEAGYFHGVPFSDFASFHRARVLTRQRTHQQEWH